LKDDTEEWQSAGVILYTQINNVPAIRIITSKHVYEMQACRFDPIMQKFAMRVDNIFNSTQYDSFDRVLKLIDVSHSGYCSEREKKLSEEIELLKEHLHVLENELDIVRRERNDLSLVRMFNYD